MRMRELRPGLGEAPGQPDVRHQAANRVGVLPGGTRERTGLVDELRVLTFPVVTGPGKRLFGDGVAAGAWRLTDCSTTGTGVVIAVYRPDGPLRSGGFDVEDGTEVVTP